MKAGQYREEAFLIGRSPAIRAAVELVRRAAPTDATVLIEGESGTGKELVAQALHAWSHRRRGPMVAVNCAALPDSIIESELFGHVKGAFTGAIAAKDGRFALATGGTLFLDEIGDLSPMGQADLLRVLEDGVYRPLGSPRTVRADARIIAATNQSLAGLCAEGRFRSDLLYRLEVVSLRLPPLRERREDIPELAARFARSLGERHGRGRVRLSQPLVRHLARMDWPGNLRQLRNVIERMVVLYPGGMLGLKEFSHVPSPASPRESHPLEEMTLAEAEQELIRRALARCGGNITAAAARLGISRRSLHYRLAAAREKIAD